MDDTRDPLRIALHLGVYVFFYALGFAIFFRVLDIFGSVLADNTLTVFLAALFCNLIPLRIYDRRNLPALGLRWSRRTAWNLGLGLLAGIISASVVVCAPLLARAAAIRPAPGAALNWPAVWFTGLMLLFGAAGEELLFRGYGFQILLRALGPFSTILPVAIIFAALHMENPHASRLGILNTFGFGVLFGYAFLRSHDLWLPIGMHFGWNLTLPFFGVNLSGLTMRLTGYTLEWSAGPLWSGGAYGPEGSLLTSGVLAALFVFLWKAPVRRQENPLLDLPGETLNASPQ